MTMRMKQKPLADRLADHAYAPALLHSSKKEAVEDIRRLLSRIERIIDAKSCDGDDVAKSLSAESYAQLAKRRAAFAFLAQVERQLDALIPRRSQSG